MTARSPESRVSAGQAAERLRRIAAGGEDNTVAMTPLAPTVAVAVPAPMATSVMPVQTAYPPPPPPPPARHRARNTFITLLFLIVVAAAAVVVVLVVRQTGGSGSCVTATPQLTPQSLESDMQHLESLVCGV
jgi:hypothetical protein